MSRTKETKPGNRQDYRMDFSSVIFSRSSEKSKKALMELRENSRKIQQAERMQAQQEREAAENLAQVLAKTQNKKMPGNVHFMGILKPGDKEASRYILTV